jgi:hypothetical protein
MNKYLRVTMPDGSQWDVSVSEIARDRASYYAEQDTGAKAGDKFAKVFMKEYNYTMKNDDELMDWATNNMNWSDVSAFAQKVEPRKLSAEEFQEGWLNGEKVIVYNE